MKAQMFLDHHIQVAIIDALRGGKQQFSTIKPDGIENSLFMYHVRKLTSRGIIERTEEGYVFTPAGARWVHRLDQHYKSHEPLRCLVQFFIIHGDYLLVAVRQGKLAPHMNRYLLPGALHRFGQSSASCADTLARTLGVQRGALLTQLETIAPKVDLHALVDIYAAIAPSTFTPADAPEYHYEYIPLKDVAQFNFDESGALNIIATRYLEGTLEAHELVIRG